MPYCGEVFHDLDETHRCDENTLHVRIDELEADRDVRIDSWMELTEMKDKTIEELEARIKWLEINWTHPPEDD